MNDQQVQEIKPEGNVDRTSVGLKYEKPHILQHDRPNCIGCAACEAVAPNFWEMNPDGKSDIKAGKHREDGWQELDIEDKDFQGNKDAAESCPVNVIHLIDKKTGKRII